MKKKIRLSRILVILFSLAIAGILVAIGCGCAGGYKFFCGNKCGYHHGWQQNCHYGCGDKGYPSCQYPPSPCPTIEMPELPTTPDYPCDILPPTNIDTPLVPSYEPEPLPIEIPTPPSLSSSCLP